MSILDWVVLVTTILAIVTYGIWKSRGSSDIRGYLLANKELKWWTIGLSVMATQASAITFLSTPGQAYDDGMRFVQFYFGLPIAIVIISAVAIPIYHKLNVFTAYEYLEKRFDLKTRTMGAVLFLAGRSIAAGLTIYAPALILSVLLGWEIQWLCVAIGLIVITYTVSGGTKAVSVTQKQQMLVILIGMVVAGVILVFQLPPDVSFIDALHIAGKMDKLNVITSPSSLAEFDPKDRYNIWTGILGGTFLQLSYFGTDQSQVQRYLGGKSITESRLGLLFNAMFKVPMQFLILFVGVMLFVFYQFERPPLVFNSAERESIYQSKFADDFRQLEQDYLILGEQKESLIYEMEAARKGGNEGEMRAKQEELRAIEIEYRTVKQQADKLILGNNRNADINDKDKVFLTFIINNLPQGLVGLLIAVILSAAMSSTSAELNALATTSVVDIYKRMMRREGSDKHFLNASRTLTLFWGLSAIAFALFASKLDNLIQAVNIIGSLFYGTILGIFVVAFFMRWVKGTAVFWAACVSQLVIVVIWLLPQPRFFPESMAWLDIGFLWYNPIGCIIVCGVAALLQATLKQSPS